MPFLAAKEEAGPAYSNIFSVTFAGRVGSGAASVVLVGSRAPGWVRA